MKKRFLILSLMIALMLMAACGKKEQSAAPEETAVSEDTAEVIVLSADYVPDVPDFVPELSRIKSICELSTMKCIYHNVAYGTQYAGTGLSHMGEKSRSFMQEYDCEVEISYSVDQIKMEQNGTEIRITLPEPNITSRKLPESISPDSYIEEPDSNFNDNPIKAETISKAISLADVNMEEEIRENTNLIASAEYQAKALIENYIHQIGLLTDVEYRIIWETESKVE